MMVWTEAQKSALFIINTDYAAKIQLMFDTSKCYAKFFATKIYATCSFGVFLEGDAFVEFLVAFGTFWEEVEADAADVLFGAEVL